MNMLGWISGFLAEVTGGIVRLFDLRSSCSLVVETEVGAHQLAIVEVIPCIAGKVNQKTSYYSHTDSDQQSDSQDSQEIGGNALIGDCHGDLSRSYSNVLVGSIEDRGDEAESEEGVDGDGTYQAQVIDRLVGIDPGVNIS